MGMTKLNIKERRAKILDVLEQIYGGTETALEYDSPYQLLISTLLAAQATDKQGIEKLSQQ